MPTYVYQCKKCGHVLEELESIKAPPLVHCPNCNTDSLVRTVGGGAGLIFKGSGFYQTDYKKSSSGSRAKGTKGHPEGEKPGSGSQEPGSAGGASETPAEGKKEKQEKKEPPAKGAGPGPAKKE